MEFKQISGWEFEKLVDKKGYFIIDLREKSEYDKGHVPGAVNIPFEEFDTFIGKINNNQELILYCERGGRSFAIAKKYGEKYNMKIVNGGIRSYRGKIEISH